MFLDPITYTYLVIFPHDKYHWTLNISFLDIKTMLWHFEKWVWLATFCGRIKICQCFVLPHFQLQVTSWVCMKIFQLCGHNKKYFQIAKWGNGAKISKLIYKHWTYTNILVIQNYDKEYCWNIEGVTGW